MIPSLAYIWLAKSGNPAERHLYISPWVHPGARGYLTAEGRSNDCIYGQCACSRGKVAVDLSHKVSYGALSQS